MPGVPVVEVVDISKLAATFLREHTELQALIGRRVVVRTPQDISLPWVRFTLLDQPKTGNSRTEHLTTAMIQFDCYAGADGGSPEAADIARLVRGLLHGELPNAPDQLDDAVVTHVDIIGHMRLPDGDFEPERERVILTAQVTAHA